MTTVLIQTFLVGEHGSVPVSLEMKRFTFRFQARSWLLLNGYLKEEGNIFENVITGDKATVESRKVA